MKAVNDKIIDHSVNHSFILYLRPFRLPSCTKDSMDICAQPTEWNDRLISLMSAVLHREIRPEFTNAILDKPRRIHRPNKSGGHDDGILIKIVCIGTKRSRDHSKDDCGTRRILDMIPIFALLYRLQVSYIDSEDDNEIRYGTD